MVMPCRLEVFGQTLWAELVQQVQGSIPDLRDFDVTIGGRFAHGDALSRFGWRPEVVAEEGEGGPAEQEEEEGDRAKPWTLPGRLAVFFKPEEQRYVQEGTKMIRQ